MKIRTREEIEQAVLASAKRSATQVANNAARTCPVCNRRGATTKEAPLVCRYCGAEVRKPERSLVF